MEISFDIDSPAYIYIAWLDVFKDAMDGLEWTKEYEDTGDDIKVFTASEHPVSLYRSKQIVGPGTVTTYNSDGSSYFILIEKPLAPVESTGKLVTTWAMIRTQ